MSITLIIIIITAIISFAAFQNEEAFYKLCFWPTKVWYDKEYIRILSGGFLHANVPHLLFNMMSLYFFGPYVEVYFDMLFPGAGKTVYIVFYVLAVVVANLPDLYQNKDNQYFRAVGASGAVSAVIFASILFSPLTSIYIFLIPIGIPAFIFGGLYLAYSAYMSRQQSDNIGHLAHFSGAIFGFVFPLVSHPELFMTFIQKITNR